jgi:hypothetical protein
VCNLRSELQPVTGLALHSGAETKRIFQFMDLMVVIIERNIKKRLRMASLKRKKSLKEEKSFR